MFSRKLKEQAEQELSRSDLACLNAALPAAFTVLAWAQNPSDSYWRVATAIGSPGPSGRMRVPSNRAARARLTEPTAQLAFGASALAARTGLPEQTKPPCIGRWIGR